MTATKIYERRDILVHVERLEPRFDGRDPFRELAAVHFGHHDVRHQYMNRAGVAPGERQGFAGAQGNKR